MRLIEYEKPFTWIDFLEGIWESFALIIVFDMFEDSGMGSQYHLRNIEEYKNRKNDNKYRIK